MIFRIFSPLVALLIVTSAGAKNVDLVTLPARQTVQLTIYNAEDLTLAKETRFVTLKRGANNPNVTYYSPDDKSPWEIVEKAMKSAEQRCIPRGMDGRPWTWHVTDVRDAVQGVLLAMEKDEAIGETFNIAGPKPLLWDEVVEYLCQKLGEEYCECRLPNYWHFEFDLSKARGILGYDPQYDPKRMIDDGIAFREGKDIGVLPPAFAH